MNVSDVRNEVVLAEIESGVVVQVAVVRGAEEPIDMLVDGMETVAVRPPFGATIGLVVIDDFFEEQMLDGHVGNHWIGKNDFFDGFVDSVDGGPTPFSFFARIKTDSVFPVTVSLWIATHSLVLVSHESVAAAASKVSPLE